MAFVTFCSRTHSIFFYLETKYSNSTDILLRYWLISKRGLNSIGPFFHASTFNTETRTRNFLIINHNITCTSQTFGKTQESMKVKSYAVYGAKISVPTFQPISRLNLRLHSPKAHSAKFGLIYYATSTEKKTRQRLYKITRFFSRLGPFFVDVVNLVV